MQIANPESIVPQPGYAIEPGTYSLPNAELAERHTEARR